MRQYTLASFLGVALVCAGCAPELLAPVDESVLGIVVDAGAGDPPSVPSTSGGNTAVPADSLDNPALIGASVGRGAYQLFDVGPTNAGDYWSVAKPALSFTSGAFAVVLFDADYNLMMRTVVTSASPLGHIARYDTGRVYVAVAPAGGADGGDFRFTVARNGGAGVPAVQPQVVWLNFGPGQEVRVHRRSPMSFPAFDGSMLGATYAVATPEIKAAIVAAMRSDYARYNIVIMSSDVGPPPDGSFSTIHFGGEDAGLLGLADNVDHYNSDPAQNAIIYVGSFAPYEVMELDPGEMGLMIANVASHELGHLLGLYHTRDPHELMDTTGTAWNLASDQSFARAPLDPTVFPMGMQDTPRLLQLALGVRPDAPAAEEPPLIAPEKVQRRALLRRVANEELRGGCGTCLHLDD